MKKVTYFLSSIGISLLGLFLTSIGYAKGRGWWNTEQIYLEGALLILFSLVLINFLLIKFFINNINRGQKIFISIMIIAFNIISISSLIHSLDGSAINIFGLKLNEFASQNLILPLWFFLPKYLFLIALIIGLVFVFVYRRLRKSNVFYYPYQVVALYAFFLVPIYILNFNFFYTLFGFNGIFSHTEHLTLNILRLIAIILSLSIPLSINKQILRNEK